MAYIKTITILKSNIFQFFFISRMLNDYATFLISDSIVYVICQYEICIMIILVLKNTHSHKHEVECRGNFVCCEIIIRVLTGQL